MEFDWPMGVIPITAKELKEFQDQAEMRAIYERQYGNMVTYALELENKLEAIKKQLFVVPSIHVQDYQRMMRKIKEILEAEGDA